MAALCAPVMAQQDNDDDTPLHPFDGVEYKFEAQASVSKGQTPLWLNANKYGLSSLDKTNGYFRAAVERPLSHDDERKWGVGYALDVAVPVHYSSKAIIQQAYVEGRWLKGALTVGSKEWPMELKNPTLSTGSQTLGINARPVPQVRLALRDYWSIPGTRGWLRLKGHIAYGKMTDTNWQHTFTNKEQSFSDGQLYHSKAGYLKIGNEDRFMPFSVELGVEMATIFGGTSYVRQADGSMQVYEGERGLKAFWHAFKPGGGDPDEGIYSNVAGNTVGSWVARVNWDDDSWRLSAYADKFFEDHSSMLQLDYDGYGEGEEWNVNKKRRYLVYDFKDWLLGLELAFKYQRPIQHVVFEYIYTKYQSGPIYHDHTQGMSDHIGGNDNFYNHYIGTGWQHWGQVIGNPLYLSPIYNDDGTIEVKNNRFLAFHLGVDGALNDNLSYRAKVTYQDGLGTYATPFHKKRHNVSTLAELQYQWHEGWLKGWQVRGSYGMDLGSIIDHNYGFQLTISKTGLLSKH